MFSRGADGDFRRGLPRLTHLQFCMSTEKSSAAQRCDFLCIEEFGFRWFSGGLRILSINGVITADRRNGATPNAANGLTAYRRESADRPNGISAYTLTDPNAIRWI